VTTESDNVIEISNVNLWYGDKQALFDVSMPVRRNRITALIGPSGCGKSTLLRSMNRMNDLVDGCRLEGRMLFGGTDIYSPNTDVNGIRTRIGMIFQKPNPFPMSIRDNVSYGPRIHGVEDREELDEIVERSLVRSALWDEVHDRLDKSALALSGGQQQRLCIARTLAIEPEIILFDEPCSALDPIATAKIEDLLIDLKKDYTVVIVTHNMQQAARVADCTAFFYLGELIEYGSTRDLFEKPEKDLTEQYITGRMG